jgi:hypothetical protein
MELYRCGVGNGRFEVRCTRLGGVHFHTPGMPIAGSRQNAAGRSCLFVTGKHAVLVGWNVLLWVQLGLSLHRRFRDTRRWQ